MILALETPEVATDSSKGKGGRPRIEVKDGLLLNRIDMQGDGSSKDEGIELSLPIFPDSTDPSFGRRDGAPVIAEMTLDLSSFQRIIKHGFFHNPFAFHEVRSSAYKEGQPTKDRNAGAVRGHILVSPVVWVGPTGSFYFVTFSSFQIGAPRASPWSPITIPGYANRR